MPYRTKPSNAAYKPPEPLPQHLAHKPVYALPYENFDGIYIGDTDTYYLSVGLSQWNSDEVSIKTMRHPREKWSRQSEEIPLHRVIDITIFLAKVIFDQRHGRVEIPRGTFLDQDADILITPEARTYGEMSSYNAFLNKHYKLIKDRLNVLYNVLNSLKEAGKL
jgi:uncharacterized protein (UPF0248 family)